MDAAALNQMLENRVKDLAARKPERSREDHLARAKTDREALGRCLGLWPMPPRTDLAPRVTGRRSFDGYRLERLVFESRPGLPVPCHLYLPDGDGPWPVALCPHGHFTHKKSEPVVQAQAIGLALQGIAALVVESPGRSWDDNAANERASMGGHDDAFLWMGSPVQGVYVWDLVRGLDYLATRTDVDLGKVGITGCSGGGTAAMLAFALDDRIGCAAIVCAASSLEEMPHNGCRCNHVPGILALGDRADVIALRAPAPVMLVGALQDAEFPPEGHRRTAEKLRAIQRLFSKAVEPRLELVESGHDLNRRMREGVLAFLAEHLQGEPARSYLAERRPLTDGVDNPYPANTLDPLDPELRVFQLPEATLGFRDLLNRALAEPYPEAFDPNQRLAPWGTYGHIRERKPSRTLKLVEGEGRSDDGDVVSLPFAQLDDRLLAYLGIGAPEFLAQVLHLWVPGGPEGWESVAMGGDVLTSMIASMKTLVGKSAPEVALESVSAEGPAASMAALHFGLLRPGLTIEVSHRPKSWREVLEMGHAALIQPQARTLAFPF